MLSYGPYKVIRELGSGGMGRVFLAEGPRGEQVAVKSLKELGPSRIEAIRREVTLLRDLHHPNIVRFLDEGLDEKEPWYAMEFIEGISLRDMIDGETMETVVDASLLSTDVVGERGPATEPLGVKNWRDLMPVICDVLSGLNAIHAVGVIHRDIKPENILVRPDHSAVLLDFGVAGKLTGTIDREELSDSTDVGATPAYAPPEQQVGEAVDARADMYALGGTLFEVLTGMLPYRARTAIAMYTAHVEEPIPSVRDFNPEVPASLDRLVGRLLAKAPRDRPGFAFDVDLEMREILGMPAPEYKPASYIYHPMFTGRAAELDQLRDFLRGTAQGKSLLATVKGIAGIGKTRLLQELVRDAQERTQIVVVQSRGARTAVERAWDRISFERQSAFEALDLSQIHDPTYVEWMRSVLVRAVKEKPLVIVFDDAPNLDGDSIHAIVALAGAPIPGMSVILSMRSDDPETPAFADMPVDLSLHLKELTRADVELMLHSMLALKTVPERHLDFVIRQSQGNPFVVAELVRYGMELGLIWRRDGMWEFKPDANVDVWKDIPVPERLARMYFRRFVRLPSKERDILYAIAIAGDGAPEELIRSICLDLTSLGALVAREIVLPVDDGTVRLYQPRMVEIILESMDAHKRELYEERATHWWKAFSKARTKRLGAVKGPNR